MPRIYVSEEAFQLLTLGNRVIEWVRQLTPFGAGNQFDDVARTRGAADGWTRMAYDVQYRNGVKAGSPRRQAVAAIHARAGNCDQQGALAYWLLREVLPNTFQVMLIVNTVSHHVYAAFYPSMRPNEIYVVDAWPIFSQTTPVGYSCFGVRPEHVVRNKPGKGTNSINLSKLKYFPMQYAMLAELANPRSIYRTYGQPGNPSWNEYYATRPDVVFVWNGTEVRWPSRR